MSWRVQNQFWAYLEIEKYTQLNISNIKEKVGKVSSVYYYWFCKSINDLHNLLLLSGDIIEQVRIVTLC